MELLLNPLVLFFSLFGFLVFSGLLVVILAQGVLGPVIQFYKGRGRD